MSQTHKWAVLGILAAIVGTVLATNHQRIRAVVSPASTTQAADPAGILTATVKRQDLRVTFTEAGRLRAIKSVPIMLQIPDRQMRITWLIEEGKRVSIGEKLVAFESKELIEQRDTLIGAIEDAKQKLSSAISDISIEKSKGEGEVKTANSKLAEAKALFQTYRDFDAPKEINEIDKDSVAARKSLSDARKRRADIIEALDALTGSDEQQTRDLQRELGLTDDDILSSTRLIDEKAKQLKIFRKVQYPRQMNTKRDAVESAQAELNTASINAVENVKKKESEKKKIEEEIGRLEKQRDTTIENIAKCEILSPASGLVVYGDPSNPYRYYGREIQVGAEWYGGNILMTIPDPSAFEVDIGIPEEYRGQITSGLKTTLTFEAVPGLLLAGEIKTISEMGQNSDSFYSSSNSPTFRSVITIFGNDPRMRSGMSARVEILAAEIPSVLTLPIEAVFNHEGSPTVFVNSGNRYTRQYIRIGKRNLNLVEVAEGLSEGTTITLTEPPAGQIIETEKPSFALTLQTPTSQPTTSPTSQPTTSPASQPATMPTTHPTTAPTTQPQELHVPGR